MATLILTVPDEMAQTIAALPDANRAAYLATINDFAVSLLAHDGITVPTTNPTREQTNGNGHSENAHEYHPDPDEDDAPFTDADAFKEAFADFDAGNRGKPAAQSFALLATRLGFKNTTL